MLNHNNNTLNINGLLLYSTWNSVLCGLDGRGVWREWTHVYVWMSPFAAHLKLSQHCLLIGYTPIQNKKFKKYINGLNQRLANSAIVI